MIFSPLLNKSALVKLRTETDAGGGEVTVTATTIATKACRIWAISGQDQLTYGKKGIDYTHNCILENGYAVTEKNSLVVDSITYDIISVDEVYDSNSLHHYALILKAFRPK